MSTTTDERRAKQARAQETQADGPSRWPVIIAVLCLLFLAFLVGSFVMHRGLFPAEPLRRAFKGGIALYEKLTAYSDPLETDFWKPARTDAKGVTRYDPGRAQNGLTLYTSGHEQTAYLMDMEGRVVHSWDIPYSRIWDESAAVKDPRPDPFVFVEKAQVFPNGDLLALYTAIGDTPWGYGLVKYDKDGNVLWKYLTHTHHDFDLDAQGNIYVLTQDISEVDLPGFQGLNKPRVDDFVVKLSPDGKEIGKLWLTGTFAASPLGRKLYFVPWFVHQSDGDYLHANSVDVLDKPLPGVPQSRAGQVLVSLREVSTLALADLEGDKIVWALSGSWVRQHDAQAMPNGNILLFDNEGDPSGNGVSRIMEFDPQNYTVTWSYSGRPQEPLDSVARGSQNRLANGNTLIVESYSGRLLEVTPEGDIVWEFVNPARGGANEELVPIVHWVERLDPQRDFGAAFRNSLDLED